MKTIFLKGLVLSGLMIFISGVASAGNGVTKNKNGVDKQGNEIVRIPNNELNVKAKSIRQISNALPEQRQLKFKEKK